ncbi:hypothetical protein CXZ10_15595 [Pleomorphomonas diazotrophica]|uniref:Uncharacterized protein n=2 Tax=Pleomorphomonas diazotrophica TaxID=1166257 RepID=A0A2N3LUA5_9HYPH|nr:hypothetical protein CXZ10_15595 [Pleomorphomonas diazotrophica]
MIAAKPGVAMPHHPPRHSSASDAGRSAIVTIRPSVLRLGVVARLAGAGLFVAGIWALIGWVLR